MTKEANEMFMNLQHSKDAFLLEYSELNSFNFLSCQVMKMLLKMLICRYLYVSVKSPLLSVSQNHSK